MGKLTITDKVGFRGTRFTVTSRASDKFSPSGKRRVMWNCICDCQTEFEVRSDALTTTHSCGCLKIEVAKSRAHLLPRNGKTATDLIGNSYGYLTVTSRAENKPTGVRSLVTWHCVCECGVKSVVTGQDLRTGNTTSCGCKVGGEGYTFLGKCKSPDFGTRQGYLYILRLSGMDEDFLKVGVSSRPNQRFALYRKDGFHVEPVLLLRMQNTDAGLLEMRLLRFAKKSGLKHKTNLEFAGKTECCILTSLDSLLEIAGEYYAA